APPPFPAALRLIVPAPRLLAPALCLRAFGVARPRSLRVLVRHDRHLASACTARVVPRLAIHTSTSDASQPMALTLRRRGAGNAPCRTRRQTVVRDKPTSL